MEKKKSSGTETIGKSLTSPHSDVTNEVKRARHKLSILEMEGCIPLLSDLIDIVEFEVDGRVAFTTEGKTWILDNLKEKYLKIIREHETGKGYVQAQLFAED